MPFFSSRSAIVVVMIVLSSITVAIGTDLPAPDARLRDPDSGVLVVAHRGCHNPAPAHGYPQHAPENSLAGLERCIIIGADLMETDVRRAGDGTLVMFHDESVDRTTDGHGKVETLTWADLSRLRLKDDEGQPGAALTDLHPVSLGQMLAAAKGRLMLNLDVKDAIYSEVIAAVRQAGMEHQVLLKTSVGTASAPIAAISPFDTVPFMPILMNPHGDADLGSSAEGQFRNGARPVALELPPMQASQLPAVVAVAQRMHARVFVNTLWEGFLKGYGGDAQAVAHPEQVWGRLIHDGVSMIQTDEPEALVAFLKHRDPATEP